MKNKKSFFKYKDKDKFTIIDNLVSKIFIISLSTIIVFNISNYMFKNNFYQNNILSVQTRNITNKFKIGIFDKNNIKIKPFKDKITLPSKDDIYIETIYFTKNKDLGKLIEKSIDLIELSSMNIKERYIEVIVKNYDTGEDFFIVDWNKNNKFDYNVYIK